MPISTPGFCGNKSSVQHRHTSEKYVHIFIHNGSIMHFVPEAAGIGRTVGIEGYQEPEKCPGQSQKGMPFHVFPLLTGFQVAADSDLKKLINEYPKDILNCLAQHLGRKYHPVMNSFHQLDRTTY